TASLASPATERSAARTIPSGPVREKDRLFLFQAASHLELSLRPLSTIDFRLTRTSQRQAIPEYLALETRQLSLQQDVHASAVLLWKTQGWRDHGKPASSPLKWQSALRP